MTVPIAPSQEASERDLLRTIAAGTAPVVGKAFFRSLVRHVADALGADVAFVAEYVDSDPPRGRTLAAWPSPRESLGEGVEFGLEGSPCVLTLDQDVVAIPDGVCERFPADPLVLRYGLDGYLAIVLRGSRGERLGYLGVQSKRRLDASDDEVTALSIFGSRAAAEIERQRHESALRERETEVNDSRARVVQAADEERKRIGRNLHDGAQQRLLALGNLVKLARRKLDSSPEEAAALLATVETEAGEALQELQELSRGLHPSGLVECGLMQPLETLAARLTVPLEIVALPERRLLDVIEVTLYYLISEAATNASKHAHASAVKVEVHQRGRTIYATVSDDGVGGASAERGSGLAGLVDRVESLGGTLTIESPPGGGTRIDAVIPLSPWRDAREPFLEFGHEGDGGSGERLIRSILEGRKTAAVSLSREWELEGGTPSLGMRLPIRDQDGRRWGEVEVTRVVVLPFGQIDPAVVDAESAGMTTLEEWRADQRSFYDNCRDETAVLLGEPGWRLTDDEPMTIVWFRLVEASPPDR
ncbi:MAG TPA: histidine kinase [Thermoleophilaceae bacterium]|nr:histidine kinase [Thermoleophilaceae bacterium]